MPPVLSWRLGALPCSGRDCRKSPMVTLPLASNCWRVITVTGAGVVRSLRRIREPVTTSSSPAVLRSAAGGGALVGTGGSGAACASGEEDGATPASAASAGCAATWVAARETATDSDSTKRSGIIGLLYLGGIESRECSILRRSRNSRRRAKPAQSQAILEIRRRTNDSG